MRRRRQRRRVRDLGDGIRVRFCPSALGDFLQAHFFPGGWRPILHQARLPRPVSSALSPCSAHLVQEAQQLLGVLVIVGVVERSGSAQARDWASAAIDGKVAIGNRCDGRQGAMRHATMRHATRRVEDGAATRTVTSDEVLLVGRKKVTSTPRVTLLPVSSQLWSPASARSRPATQDSPLPDGELERQEVARRNELLCSVSLVMVMKLTRSDPSMLLELGFAEDLE